MPNPQCENGYTKLANEIIDALSGIRIPGEEMQCLWVIIRKTYGFQKKEDKISLSQFVLSTGISKPNICRALSGLISKNIIIKNDNANPVSYRLQKDYSRWKPLSKKIMLSKTIMPVINIDNDRYQKRVPQKKLLQKKLIQNNIVFNFETEQWENITEKDKERWKKTYPACDIDQELLYMADWLVSNPEHKKSNYKRFISNWLKKNQDRGGTKQMKQPSSLSRKEREWQETKRKILSKGEDNE